MSNPSPAPSSPRVSSGTRRLFPLAALVIAGASLAVGCSSDDTTPEAKASSTEVTAESGGTEASVGDLKISNARIGEPAGPNTGMFLSITNDGDTADRLVAVTTGISPEVQAHERAPDGDRTRMQELPPGFDVPAGTTTVLEPGGLHAMFMKVEPLTADEQVPVTLSFDKAGDVEVEVPVIPLTELGGSMGHSDMDSDGGDHGGMDHG